VIVIIQLTGGPTRAGGGPGVGAGWGRTGRRGQHGRVEARWVHYAPGSQ